MFRQLNQLPFGVHYDAESRTSTIYSRVYEQLVTLPGRWPRCDYSLAVAAPADAPKLYGVKPVHTFYREHDSNAPLADPAVRRRLKHLVDSMPALKAELRRRSAMQTAVAEDAKPTQAAKHADLISLTFNDFGKSQREASAA